MAAATVRKRDVKFEDALRVTPGDLERLFLHEIDAEFRAIVAEGFRTEGSSMGVRWKALKPRYREWKAKVRPGRTKLIFDGNLRDSWTKQGGEHIARVRGKTMQFGSSNALATKHQKGEDGVPARPVQLTEAQRRQLAARFRELYIERKVDPLIRALRAAGT